MQKFQKGNLNSSPIIFDEFPIKCKIYLGNTSDKTMVSTILEEIKDAYKVKEFIFVGTNEQGYEGEKLIKIYKNLNKVETAFRIIKNDLDIRPMYHWKEERVKGHVYICVLSYSVIMVIVLRLTVPAGVILYPLPRLSSDGFIHRLAFCFFAQDDHV